MDAHHGVIPRNGQQMTDEEEALEAAKIASMQRRKLSVAPTHVGDITAAARQVNRHGSIANQLTDVETKAKGAMLTAAKSQRGFVPYNRNKVNQDRALIKFGLQNDESISVFGVMDGHGEFGHLVAAFVQDRLPVWLGLEQNLKTQPEQCIANACKRLTSELSRSNINCAFSGTTLVFVVKIDEILYCANIGDSRCVLASRGSDGKIVSKALSRDHKPDDPLEKKRILAEGGRVETLPGPPGVDMGPYRVWLATVDVPGLAMSRSIGDSVSHTVGVTHIPEIFSHKIQEEDEFLVLGSDGVWEFVENDEALAIVEKTKANLSQAADHLIVESTRRWRIHEEVIDDITTVIVSGLGKEMMAARNKTTGVKEEPSAISVTDVIE